MSGGPLAAEISSLRQELAAVKLLVSGIESRLAAKPKLNLKPFLSLKCSGLDQVERDSPRPPILHLRWDQVELFSPQLDSALALGGLSLQLRVGRCESGPLRIFGRYLCCESRSAFIGIPCCHCC